MDLAREESPPKPKQLFTVYAYQPMLCEVEATSAEEAKKLAVEQGTWSSRVETPELDDIYCVVPDDEEEASNQTNL